MHQGGVQLPFELGAVLAQVVLQSGGAATWGAAEGRAESRHGTQEFVWRGVCEE